MAIELVDLPIENAGFFHRFWYAYHMVQPWTVPRFDGGEPFGLRLHGHRLGRWLPGTEPYHGGRLRHGGETERRARCRKTWRKTWENHGEIHYQWRWWENRKIIGKLRTIPELKVYSLENHRTEWGPTSHDGWYRRITGIVLWLRTYSFLQVMNLAGYVR